MSSVCVDLLKAYLEGGDNTGFGNRDPFRKYSGGGGCDGLAKALAESLTEDDCPDSDSRYSAILFGKIVGSSSLEAADRSMVRIFMEVAYEDHVTAYTKGLSVAKTVKDEKN